MASHFRITDSAISAFVVRHCRQTAIPVKLCGSLARGRAIMIKVTKPNQDMRFDVPVIGIHTIETMKQAGATCLAVDAGRCLLLDVDGILAAADQAGIAIVSGSTPE